MADVVLPTVLEAVPLWKVMQACEDRLQTLRGKLVSHTIDPLEFHRRLCGLEHACELADQLHKHGFDELYVPEKEKVLTFRDGWLPLHGSDLLKYLRALRAAGVHRSYLQGASYVYFPSPKIRIIEDGVYVEWPEGVYSGYPTALLRLDDASLGERFTSDVEFSEVGQELLGRFRGRLKALLKTAYTISVPDYLKVARRVCGYAVRIYGETGFPVQMLRPYLTAANTLYVVKADWVDIFVAGRVGHPVGYLKPYDPRYGPILAAPGMAYDTPRFLELEGEDLLKTLSSLAGSGTLIHRGEDGSELYLLDKPGSERALRRAFGRRSFEQIANHVFPKLGTELYLYIESGNGAGLYDTDMPPLEYVATAFAARALHLNGEVLRVRVEGLPGPLLSLFSDKLTVSARTVRYCIATSPKVIDLSGDGTYYDWETELGVAVY